MMKRKQIIIGICSAIVLLLLVYLAALIGGNTDKTDGDGTLPAGTTAGEDRAEDELGEPGQTTEQSGNTSSELDNASAEQTGESSEGLWPDVTVGPGDELPDDEFETEREPSAEENSESSASAEDQLENENPSAGGSRPESSEQMGSDDPSESADPSETEKQPVEETTDQVETGSGSSAEEIPGEKEDSTEESQPETSGGLVLPDDIF